MTQIFAWTAATLSAITFVVHVFVGGRYVARPLLDDRSLPRASKWLNYYCWHIVSLLIAAMTLAFAAFALGWASADLTIFLAALSFLLSLLSIGVALTGGIRPWRFPSTTLFMLIAISATLAWKTPQTDTGADVLPSAPNTRR